METTWQIYKSKENIRLWQECLKQLLDIILLWTTMQKLFRCREMHFLDLFQGEEGGRGKKKQDALINNFSSVYPSSKKPTALDYVTSSLSVFHGS